MNLIPRNFFLDDFFDDFGKGKNNDMKCDVYEEGTGVFNGDTGIIKQIIEYKTYCGRAYVPPQTVLSLR